MAALNGTGVRGRPSEAQAPEDPDGAGDHLGAESLQTLGTRLRTLHGQLSSIAPTIDRVACAIYDRDDGTLATFIDSTRTGTSIHGYRYALAGSASLSELARTGKSRLLTQIQQDFPTDSEHSRFITAQGYQSSLTFPLLHGGELLGFLFFDSRDPDAFTPALQRELALHASVVCLMLASELVAVRTLVGTLQVARDFAELRDLETGAHLERMAKYSRLIAQRLAEPLGLTDEYVLHLFRYAPLHDIGKIGIPDRVLLKDGPLDEEEWEVMRSHPRLGRAMVDDITSDLGLGALPFDHVLRAIVEDHHERLDGSGYPRGLRGEEVPIAARIIAIADIFDALTSPRPYKPAWSIGRTLEELRDQARRGALDAMAVEALAGQPDEVAEIRALHAEPAGAAAGSSAAR